MKVFLIGIILCFISITILVTWYSTNRQTKIDKKIVELYETATVLISELKQFNNNFAEVTITHYHPMSMGINSDTDPLNTAFMRTPKPGRTVAISRELYNMGWAGCEVYIPGSGIRICEDLMSKSIEGLCIDICVNTKTEAFEKGKRMAMITKLHNFHEVLL